MQVHLYSSPSGRVLAVDDCATARNRLPPIETPTPMFFGQRVPATVADQCLRECGGLWLHADGLQRYPPPASTAHAGTETQAESVSTKNSV